MNRIKKTGESIKNKLKDDSVPVCQEAVLSERQHVIKPERRLASKRKVTYYISFDKEAMLNEVYTKRIMNGNKMDKSGLMERAIELLWKEEKNYDL